MKKIEKQINELKDTVHRIKEQHAHQIDIDAALQQIRDIYLEVLKLGVSTSDKKTERPIELIPEGPSPKEKAEKQEEKVSEQESETTEMSKKPAPPKDSPKEEERASIPRKKKEETPEKPRPEKKKKTAQTSLFGNNGNSGHTEESATIGESLGKDKQSVNDIIAQKKSRPDIASKLQAKPVNDIKSAIGLGDRFMYIKALFDGSADLFHKTIEDLNAMQDYEEADNYLKSNFEWNENDTTVQNFKKIVARKYIKKN